MDISIRGGIKGQEKNSGYPLILEKETEITGENINITLVREQ